MTERKITTARGHRGVQCNSTFFVLRLNIIEPRGSQGIIERCIVIFSEWVQVFSYRATEELRLLWYWTQGTSGHLIYVQVRMKSVLIVILVRSAVRLMASVTIPSYITAPLVGINLNSASVKLLLPEPVLPTTPMRSPDLISNVISCNTSGPSTE